MINTLIASALMLFTMAAPILEHTTTTTTITTGAWYAGKPAYKKVIRVNEFTGYYNETLYYYDIDINEWVVIEN